MFTGMEYDREVSTSGLSQNTHFRDELLHLGQSLCNLDYVELLLYGHFHLLNHFLTD